MEGLKIDASKYLNHAIRNSPDKWKIKGFAMLPTALLMNEEVSRCALLVYWVFAMHTFRGKQYCFPSLNTIAKEAHCSKGTAIKATKELERLGYVRANRGKGKREKTNQYYLINGIP